MSLEREKAVHLKKKIKALEFQIEQKNSILTSIKHTEITNEERLKNIKSHNEAKLKNLSKNITKLRTENTILKSKLPTTPNKYYLPPISKSPNPHRVNSRNVSAGPRLEKNLAIETPIQDVAQDEEKNVNMQENNENSENFRVKTNENLNDDNINEKIDGYLNDNNNDNNYANYGNYNGMVNEQYNGNLNVSTLTKQMETLKIENEKLKVKNKQINEKFHVELATKEKELLELRKLKIDLGVLSEKFEILSRRNKPKDNNQQQNNDQAIKISSYKDNFMFLNKKIQDLNKAIEMKISENDKIKEEVNKYKMKARHLIAEKKQIFEPKEKNDKECQCDDCVEIVKKDSGQENCQGRQEDTRQHTENEQGIGGERDGKIGDLQENAEELHENQEELRENPEELQENPEELQLNEGENQEKGGEQQVNGGEQQENGEQQQENGEELHENEVNEFGSENNKFEGGKDNQGTGEETENDDWKFFYF